MASSTIPAFPVIVKSESHRSRRCLQIRAGGLRDEGRSGNTVDANLQLLRDRIEVIRIKERLQRCYAVGEGWNYSPICNNKKKQELKSTQFSELAVMVGGTFSLPILCGTLCLCLASILVHLN